MCVADMLLERSRGKGRDMGEPWLGRLMQQRCGVAGVSL